MNDEPRAPSDPSEAEPTSAPQEQEPARVPEPVDEGAVTRELSPEEALTRELVLPDPDPDARDEPEPDPDPVPASPEVEAEPSLTEALAQARLERLVPALFEPEPEPEPQAPPEFRSEPASPTRRPKPKSMFGLIRPNGAVILLGLLCALAVVEMIAAFLQYRERIAAEDWSAVEQLLAAHEGDPVIVASEWLAPSARMHLARAREWDSMAFPDLRGHSRFWLLAHASERPWRGALRAELEQRPRPELVGIHRIGDLTLHEYRQEVGELRFSLLDSIRSVSTARGRCSGSRGQYRCKDGSLAVVLQEIDYRTRRCLAVELDDGVIATVDLGEVELGDRVYGHVGFGDFNARLRADPAARLELVIDDVVVGRWVFTDDQGWASFALATAPGRGHVQLRVGTSVGGTWQREGHRNSPTDSLCVELRGFDESGLGAAARGGT